MLRKISDYATIAQMWMPLPILASLSLFAACSAERATPENAPANAGSPAQTAVTTNSATSEAATVPDVIPAADQALKPPAPDSVLYAIYGKDGDGAVRYQVDFGSWVGWWFGHRFSIDGRAYYTGFGWKSAETLGDDGPDGAVATDGRVAISQATYRAEEKDGKVAWSSVETDGYVGEFGANDEAPQVDESRQPVEFKTGDGRMLLAVPIREASAPGNVIFVYEASERERLREGRWAYVGSVQGLRLSFQPAAANAMPDIQTNDGDTTKKDVLTYRYDAGSNSYLR